MSTDAALDTRIDDVVDLSRELTEGDSLIKGQIRLYDVEDGNTLESNAERFFERTLLTDGLEDSLKRLRDTLNGVDDTRIHEMYGPYGTGKSHQMVALYHCFRSPEAVSQWADSRVDGLDDALPSDALPVVLSMQKEQYEYLWEPLFDALDYDLTDADYDEEGGYPTIDVISDAVGDRTVAFFVDELEDFFKSLSGPRKAANKGFLQALFETSTRPDTELFSIVSVLREESEVHDILSRQQRVEVNMSNQVSIREVLRHRLVDSVHDEAALQSLVERYVDAYAETDYVDVPSGFREELHDTYPFHPELIDSLKTRYFAETESGATRGMLYLFAKVLVDQHDQTDLITHGEIDAVEYNDELGRINVEHRRTDRCYDDVVDRLSNANIDFGRSILSTVLLYSLTPGLDEGATTEDIVVGTFHPGDRINDIVIDLQRLQGEVYHLWEDDDRYVVREDENPRSLVRNAARDVSDEKALGLVAETVESVFGSGAYALGFDVDGRLDDVPDDKRVKTVVKNSPWTEETVAEVVKNQPTGRQWRNTMVFVQPSNEKSISTTDQREKFLGKAAEVVGARLRKDDQNFSEEIREAIVRLEDEYADDLESRVESAYGDVIDGGDLFDNFADATELDLQTFTGTDRVPSANEIATAARADPFDLQRHAKDILQDRLSKRSEATVGDVYERFLRDPSRPIPEDEAAVATAIEASVDDGVLAHDDGFSANLTNLDTNTTLVDETEVSAWDANDVETELRSKFGEGAVEVDLGSFELDLTQSRDVWFPETTAGDVVKLAAGRLNTEDQYVLVSGTEILDKVRSDATLRDVSDATTVDASDVRDRIEKAIDDTGAADTSDVLGSIRSDEEYYLPRDSTEDIFRRTVEELLGGLYRIETERSYVGGLGDRSPTDVTLAPYLTGDEEETVLEYVASVEREQSFDVAEVRAEAVPDRSDYAVRHVLLNNLGAEDTRYVILATGTKNPADYYPQAGFKIPEETGWLFDYDGGDPSELRDKWRDENEGGQVTFSSISYKSSGGGAAPGPLGDVVEYDESRTDLVVSDGESSDDVGKLLRRIPDGATGIDVTVRFE